MNFHKSFRRSHFSTLFFSVVPVVVWTFGFLVSTSVICRSGDDGELLKNTDFSNDAKDWKIRFGGNAKGDKEVIADGHDGNPAVQITIETKGEKANDVQIAQNVNLEKGTSYKLHFWAKSENKGFFYTRYVTGAKVNGFDKKVTLTDDWEEFEYDFSPERDKEANKSVFVFANLGFFGEGKIWLAEPSLTESDGSTSKKNVEKVKEDSKSKSKSKSKESKEASKSKDEDKEKSAASKNTKKYDFEDAGISDIGKVTKVNGSSITISLQKTKETYTYTLTDKTEFKKGSRDNIEEGTMIAIVPDADPSNAKSVRILE